MAKLEYTKLKKMVDNSIDTTQNARALSERDRDYYDHHQWTAEEQAVLNARSEPMITNNRIKMKVDGMIGIEQRSRVDPKAYPRNKADEQAADVITKALVYVDDKTDFDIVKSAAFENLLVEGCGGAEVIVEPINGKMEVVINRIRWEEMIFDPASREKNFSDSSYLGYQKWMPADVVTELYGDIYTGEEPLEEMLESSFGSNGQLGDTYEDRPFHSTNKVQWDDPKTRRVRIANIYYKRGGEWFLAIFCSAGEIYNELSPYLDEYGKTTCPIHFMTAYIDRNNERYGMVRAMISLQDEINKRYSKSLHYFNSRQTMSIEGVVDVEDMKRELNKPNGHVVLNLDTVTTAVEAGQRPFDIIPTGDQSSGQFALLSASLQALDNIGPNPSLFGQSGSGQSGRAIMAQQQAGLATVSPIFDSLREWNLAIYRSIWMRIRQYWTDERWFRITDDQNAPQFIGVNVITGTQQVLNPETGEIMMEPVMENVLAEMEVDITIEDVPDYVTLKAEQFEQLSNLAARGINIPVEMLIESSSIHHKDKLLETFARQQEQAAAQAQMTAQLEQQRMEFEAQKAQYEFQIKQQELDMERAKLESQIALNLANTSKIVSETAKIDAEVADKLTE